VPGWNIRTIGEILTLTALLLSRALAPTGNRTRAPMVVCRDGRGGDRAARIRNTDCLNLSAAIVRTEGGD